MPDLPATALPALTRRALVGAAAGVALLGPGLRLAAQDATPAGWTPAPSPALEQLTIALPTEPATLDPALTYDVDGWSIIHAIYDSLVAYDAGGALRPLLAESWDESDPAALTFRLRAGVTFHDGQPLTSADVAATFAHLTSPETASQAAGNFAAVTGVETPDDLTVRFALSGPAPYLLAQIAAYLAIIPASAIEAGADLSAAPVGTGPYAFAGWQRGQRLDLVANPGYASGPKGAPLAASASYRFIGDASTRVAELLSGGAGVVRDVPVDQLGELDGEVATAVVTPTSGVTFVRIATDAAPFDDPRVRQALNLGVDVEAITSGLLGADAPRLATLLDPTSLGFDAVLAPYAYDPDGARALLAEAGAEGIEATLEVTTPDSAVIGEAIAGQLAEIGVSVSVEIVEGARFNETWRDPVAAPMRLVTWSPMFDPYSLLSLVVASEGFLSRYASPEADALVAAGATATDPAARADAYRQLGQVLHDDPPAIFLSSVIARYGVGGQVAGWRPRPDDYILPLG